VYKITVEKIERFRTVPCAVMRADRVSVSITAVVEGSPGEITDTGECHITLKAWSDAENHDEELAENGKIVSVSGRRQSGYDETTVQCQRKF